MSMYRILAIDDEPVVRKLLQKTFAGEGYDCFVASNVLEGLQTCSEVKPDIILLDVNLPDGNGIEVCRKLKNSPELRHIPILLLTGEASCVENRIDGLEAGADDYVLKPFLPLELAARVRGILKIGTRPTR